MLRGRSQLVESFVWFIPTVRIVRLIGAWPFFVRGVNCLVFPVSVCTCKKKREEEENKREKIEKREKREREKRKMFEKKNHKTPKFHRTNCDIIIRKKKKPLEGIIRHFLFERSESHPFFN